jgi:hypothetical protein
MAERTVRGSCYCKRVRFTATLPTRFVAHCHCNNCRRAHGAGFVTWAGVPDPQFRIEAGEDQLGRYATETGALRSFCRTCGTPILYASPRWAGEVHVAVACFDEPLDRLPAAHVYADRSPPWCPITDDLPQRGGESGTEPL